MQMPTSAMLASFGRHVISYSAGAATVLVGVHALTPSQGGDLGTAVNQIVTGLTTAFGGIVTLVSLAAAAYGAWQRSPLHQIMSAATIIQPTGGKIVTTTDIASATPDHSNIISATQAAKPGAMAQS